MMIESSGELLISVPIMGKELLEYLSNNPSMNGAITA